MPKAFDDHNWRDPGFNGGYLHVQELSPEQTRAALAAQEKRDEDAAEAMKANLAAPVLGEKTMDAGIGRAVAEASHILTPEQQQNKRLQLVKQPDGSLVH